jgi:hypothetical protein
MKYTATIILVWLAVQGLWAQDTTAYMRTHVTAEGDTIYAASIDPVTIIDKRVFTSVKDQSDFRKLQRNLKIVYPYAKMARQIYADMQQEMADINKHRQQKKYKKAKEEQLKAEFEEKLKKLTTTQGKLLVMMINRYTGNDCYGLIKELKNGFAAFTWNLVGKRYGYDLKAPYVPADNTDMEMIIRALEETDAENKK